jgi:hypothetical protein
LKKTRTAVLIVAIALCVLLVVDRITLYVWQLQVIRFYRSLRATVVAGKAAPPETRFGYISIGLEPLLVMPKSARWATRFMTLRTDSLLVKPSTITVDGAGGLHLRFLPPPLAWTTWVIPRYDSEHHADPVRFDPRLHYQYKIDIDTSGAEVAVSLRRGPQHFGDPLEGFELRPLLFP